jgi:murein DD-endopeptidase MepM/ murein hydrolase activator NlpD
MFRTSSSKSRLGELLVRRRFITLDQLEQALLLQKQTGQKLGQILVQHGWINRQQLDQVLKQQSLQRAVASVLVTCGTLVSAAPKVALAQPVASITTLDRNSQRNQRQDLPSTPTNVAASVRQPALQQRLQRPQDVDAMPLAANPTESSPLIGFCHPLQGYGWLTQGYNGTSHQGRMAYARDYQISLGTPVYAMRSGRVVGIEDRYADTGGGAEKIYEFNYVLIEHPNGYRSAYLHLYQGFAGKAGIKVGDNVSAGQLIGYSGNSGWSSGPHLHVEIQRPGDPGTFGDTVPFKLGKSCGPGIVAADNPTPPSTANAQGAGDLQNQPSQLQPSSIPAINIPLACANGGCACVACATGTGHVNLSSQDLPIANSLSDRLDHLLTP